MKNYFALVVIAVVAVPMFLSVSCTKDIGKRPVSEAPDTSTTNNQIKFCDTITYAKHIKPIVDKICLSCHGDANPSAGFTLNSYESMKAKGLSGRLVARVVEGQGSFMPQGRAMSTDTTKLFSCWVENGYKQ